MSVYWAIVLMVLLFYESVGFAQTYYNRVNDNGRHSYVSPSDVREGHLLELRDTHQRTLGKLNWLSRDAEQEHRKTVQLMKKGTRTNDPARRRRMRRASPTISAKMRNSLRSKKRLTFSSWHPYRNPSRLIREGMTETTVAAIAGRPDKKESYKATRRGKSVSMTGWYYVSKHRGETTLLEFDSKGTLIRIVSASGK